MLKVLGSIFVIGTTTLLGIQKGVSIRKNYEELQYIQKLVYQIQSEIRYLRAPLGDIVVKLGRESKAPYGEWLLSLGNDMASRSGKPFSRLWEQGVRQHLGSLRLPEQEVERLCLLGNQLGNADMELQMQTLSLYQQQLSQTLEDLRKTMDNKVKLSRCIGIISGIFLVILLL